MPEPETTRELAARPRPTERRAAGAGPAPTRIEEIYEVAIALFLERGYDATPLSAIARELGLTKAGLYHHFASKEQLLFDIHQHMMRERLLPIIERAEREPEPMARLERYLREFAELMGSDPAIRLLIDETKQLTPEHQEAIRAVWRRGYRIMRRSIEELQRDGRCDPSLTPAYIAFTAIGMCNWTLYWFDHTRQETLPRVADEMARVFLRGLVAAPRREAAAGASDPDHDEERGDS